ncbi:MAG: hypothetical protein J6S60_04735 [Oscillospiraceae bacterium]|nr:hypothetical protein [Oscillospiraceae bacterium]
MAHRILAVVIIMIIAMATVPALAAPETVDLASMSLEDLEALRLRVLEAMWQTDAWQSVEVPEGAYEIGVEIPAGRWTISAREDDYATIKVVSKLNATRTDEANNAQTYAYQVISAPSSYMHDDYPSESFTVTLEKGMFIIIDDAPVIFTPPTGPSFTFK